jgi:Rab-like protein 2
MFCTVPYFRLVERFLLDGYKPQQLSTYALSLFRYQTKVEDESIIVGMPVL